MTLYSPHKKQRSIMRANTMASRLAAIVGLVAIAEAAHSHGHLHHRRHDHHGTEKTTEKRGGQCEFPSDAGLVAVTPDQQNAGWAMSPNQPCEPGNYCPYACPPGQVSMQWNPEATSYTYPLSMVRICAFLSAMARYLTDVGRWTLLRRERPNPKAFPREAILCGRNWCRDRRQQGRKALVFLPDCSPWKRSNAYPYSCGGNCHSCRSRPVLLVLNCCAVSI